MKPSLLRFCSPFNLILFNKDTSQSREEANTYSKMPLDLVPHPQDEVLELIYSIQKASNFSNWSPALRAAPEAILVMAVCLRAASHPGAKAVDVGRSWEGLDGNVIKFP